MPSNRYQIIADFHLIKKEIHDDQIINIVPNDQEILVQPFRILVDDKTSQNKLSFSLNIKINTIFFPEFKTLFTQDLDSTKVKPRSAQSCSK